MSSPVRELVGAVRRETVGNRLALPQDLISAFPELATVAWRSGGFPLRIGGWLLGQRSVAGITLGTTAFLSPAEAPSVRLLLHELGHVRVVPAGQNIPHTLPL